MPWFDSPLVQGASRLRYTDKAQVAATGPYWPKGARNKKKSSSRSDRAILAERRSQKKKNRPNLQEPHHQDWQRAGCSIKTELASDAASMQRTGCFPVSKPHPRCKWNTTWAGTCSGGPKIYTCPATTGTTSKVHSNSFAAYGLSIGTADAVAKRYRPWPPGLELTACRGSTPPWSRARVDCGVQIKLKCSDRAILAKRRSQQKKYGLSIGMQDEMVFNPWPLYFWW